jgi:hypothetical protein
MPVQGGASYPEHGADLFHRALAFILEPPGQTRLALVEGAGPATEAPASSRGLKPRECPLPDKLPLEFGQGFEDMEDQPAACGRGVQTLLYASEAHTPRLHLPHQLDQLSQGPPEPVQPRHHQHVIVAAVAERLP